VRRDRVGDVPIAAHHAPGLPIDASAPERPNRLCIGNWAILHAALAALDSATSASRTTAWTPAPHPDAPPVVHPLRDAGSHERGAGACALAQKHALDRACATRVDCDDCDHDVADQVAATVA
jgi:hypothetical protein